MLGFAFGYVLKLPFAIVLYRLYKKLRGFMKFRLKIPIPSFIFFKFFAFHRLFGTWVQHKWTSRRTKQASDLLIPILLPIHNIYPACQKFALLFVALYGLRCSYDRHPLLYILLCRIALSAESVEIVLGTLFVTH